jgi:hypothetical protein
MQHALAALAETADRNVVCLNYTDKHSVGGDSSKDMTLGRTQKMVAYGKPGDNVDRLAKCKPGDFVVITAYKERTRVFHIGILKKKVYDCTTWLDHGGKTWEHAWEYDPCTPDMDVAECVAAFQATGLSKRDATSIFSMIWCRAAYLPHIARAFRDGIFRTA